MIDIHSHILPGLDDGSPSMEVSLEMLQLAAANGTTEIVATPHKNQEFPYDEVMVAKLFRELSRRAAGVINIHLGCDFHLSVENIQEALANPGKYTINGRGYLLVELPDLTSRSAARSVFNRMIERRITPVITHPERNPSLQTHLKEVSEWVKDGCLMQVTAQSLTGRFGSRAQRALEAMLESDLVHFVASDAHDTQDRTPALKQAYGLISQRWGSEKANSLFVHNPAAALAGDRIRSTPNPKKSLLNSFLRRVGIA